MEKQVRKRRWKYERLLSLFLAFVMVFGFANFKAPTKVKASVSFEGRVFQIQSQYSQKFMGLRWDSTDVGTTIEQQNYSVNSTQLFYFVPAGDGYYHIYNLKSGLVLDLWGENDKYNELTQTYTKNNQDNQKFKLEEQSDGSYKIKVKHSGYYLTVKDDRTDHGVEIVQWPFKTSGVNNQNWRLSPYVDVQNYWTLAEFLEFNMAHKRYNESKDEVSELIRFAKVHGYTQSDDEIRTAIEAVKNKMYPKTDKVYRIRSKYSGYYLENDARNANAGNKLILRANETVDGSQFFQVVQSSVGKGYFEIKSKKNGLRVDVWGSDHGDNQIVIQHNDNNSDNQAFEFIRQYDGSYKIKAKHSGKLLTVKDNNPYEYAWVVQWYEKSSDFDNQLWVLEEYDPADTIQDFVNKEIKENKDMRVQSLAGKAKWTGLNVTDYKIGECIENYLDRDQEEIFDVKGRFITTYGMLQKPIRDLTFMGSHNAFSNNNDRRSGNAWDTYTTSHGTGTENHKASIWDHLEHGYRIIDLDIGDNGNSNTASYHRYRLSGYTNLIGKNAILPKIKNWLQNNPSQIVIINISEVYNGQTDALKLRSDSQYYIGSDGWEYHMQQLMDNMRSEGLLEKTWNYTGDNNTKWDQLYENLATMGHGDPEWPLLKEMLKADKRILLIQRDAGYGYTVRVNTDNDPNKVLPENLNLANGTIDDMKTGKDKEHKLLNMELFDDWGASAGKLEAAYINNEGRRLYNLIHEANSRISARGADKVITFALLDYVVSTTKWDRPTGNKITAIDAANRLNYENLGYNWNRLPQSLRWD